MIIVGDPRIPSSAANLTMGQRLLQQANISTMPTYQGPMTVTLKMEAVNFAPESGGSPATTGAFLAFKATIGAVITIALLFI
jgi:hypothetical protein